MEQLKPLKHWVVAYPHDKIPLSPKSMQRVDVINDPYSWADFATADACVRLNPHLILGFVLTNSPYAGVDLDTYKTQDQIIIAKHRSIYERLNSYSELSPHGGVHVVVEGKLHENKKLANEYVELISSGYITMTGNVVKPGLIQPRQLELNELYYYILEKQNKVNPMVGEEQPEKQSDDEVIRAAAAASNGELFKMLYMGKYQEAGYPSQSEADQALVDIVAFYTDSKTQVVRIFHQSELGKRAKASRKDYLYHHKYGIITRAFDQKKPNVTYENIEKIVKDHAYKEARKIIEIPILDTTMNGSNGFHAKLSKLPEFVQKDVLEFDWEPPPGVTGNIAQFIFRNAVHPVKEVAITAAIALMAGICGRAYNISNTGLNHYLVVLAATGGGKEGAASGIERLCSYVREKTPAIDQFIGPATIASPQALIKHLSNESPCFVSQKGEMGFWLQRITEKHANANDRDMRQIMLDLFMKSGQQDVFRGSIYSDKAKNVKSVNAPAFTLFGDATPHSFYRAVDEENIEEGFVSRFGVVECDLDDQPVYNEAHGTIMPDEWMVNFLAGLIRKVTNLQGTNTAITIGRTEEAYRAQLDFQADCFARIAEDRNSAEAKLYSRAHLRLLRLAGLLSVGINPDNPVLTVEAVEWARKFVIHGIARVTWRFQVGEIGERTGYIEQQKALRQFLNKYWTGGWHDSMQSQFGITQEMWNAKIITRRYLQNHLITYAPFRKSRNPGWEFELALKAMQDCGVLFGFKMEQVKESGRNGIAYYITDYEAIKEHDRPKRGRPKKG